MSWRFESEPTMFLLYLHRRRCNQIKPSSPSPPVPSPAPPTSPSPPPHWSPCNPNHPNLPSCCCFSSVSSRPPLSTPKKPIEQGRRLRTRTLMKLHRRRWWRCHYHGPEEWRTRVASLWVISPQSPGLEEKEERSKMEQCEGYRNGTGEVVAGDVEGLEWRLVVGTRLQYLTQMVVRLCQINKVKNFIHNLHCQILLNINPMVKQTTRNSKKMEDQRNIHLFPHKQLSNGVVYHTGNTDFCIN